MIEYLRGAHTKTRLMYHIVWIPKYRKRVLKNKIKERIEELIKQCCDMNNWKIEEMNVQIDHVHLIILIKPSISVSQVVQILKGGSSKKIREEFPELEEFLWGDSFWADGYFAETIGLVTEDTIKKYIHNQ